MDNSEKVFRVGHKVTFINDYGVSFPGRTITETEEYTSDTNEKKTRYKIEPTDCPWVWKTSKNLFIEYNQ
jgi:hypothetical protein